MVELVSVPVVMVGPDVLDLVAVLATAVDVLGVSRGAAGAGLDEVGHAGKQAVDLLAVHAVECEAVVLRDVEGLSYEEIAAATGVEIGTVKSRISRGRGALQKMLKDLARGDL